ncbi:hypothetical protein NHX12_010214 [Muraenolepis orangiensis]|uniref:SH2 domain-containing protein n=1 Tax=Muraenolepis orangiensis TaxID=630683 RepID=A0A9Q0DHT4_9TELE|nr:hypothetical protein NHX12_010214 [Muraenolepis orangiensis]
MQHASSYPIREDPLYDFPEPAPSPPTTTRRAGGPQRAQGSLKSVSVLDRLLFTLPVWLQLSINPATALHILQREPPGAFLVRNSRTSRRNVLCVRLTDDSVPSFVQQFGIRELHSIFCLESSAISFPDLPRLIAFYCVSRDVLPFPLELPEAIAKATSHKQLESISHMGIEFWSSQLNYRGPRESPKAKDHQKKEPGAAEKSSPTPASQLPSTAALPQPHPANQIREPSQSDAAASQSGTSPTVFQKLCPITTRGPRELNCSPGVGALCFVNPLFLQSQSVLHRRHLFKRSLKVRVSTETTSYLSPPVAPPPPPPLMPKTRGKCKPERILGDPVQTQDALTEGQSGAPGPGGREEDQTKDRVPVELGAIPAGPEATDDDEATVESLQDESHYMEPSQVVNIKRWASPSPFLKVCPLPSPLHSPSVSPPLSPYQFPSPSRKLPFSLSPFASPYISPTAEDPYHVPCSTPLSLGQDGVAEGPREPAGWEETEQEEVELLLEQLYASNLNDPECCGSLSGSEDEESLAPSPLPLPP